MADIDAVRLAELDIAARESPPAKAAPAAAKVEKLNSDAALAAFKSAVGDEAFEEIATRVEIDRILSGRRTPTPADSEVEKYLGLLGKS